VCTHIVKNGMCMCVEVQNILSLFGDCLFNVVTLRLTFVSLVAGHYICLHQNSHFKLHGNRPEHKENRYNRYLLHGNSDKGTVSELAALTFYSIFLSFSCFPA
jgi:hypothetical protein